MCPSFRTFVSLLCVLVMLVSLALLSGCQINVVHLEGAKVQLAVDASQNPYQYLEAAQDPCVINPETCQ